MDPSRLNQVGHEAALKGGLARRKRFLEEGSNTTPIQFPNVYTVPSFVPKMDSPKRPTRTRWRTELYEFSQNTTIHALKQITEPTPFRLRSVIWFLLLVLGLTIFVLQVVQSVIYYWSNPVAVNININYNDTLRFPAVTICNQNAFKMTEASDLGYYEALTDLFSKGKNTKNKLVNTSQIYDLPLNELLLQLAHKEHDFIVSCMWSKTACQPDDIKMSLTDYGVCYTFNAGERAVKQVSQTGAQWGLRLQLNLEQYEYMTGPTSGAGVKVLVHEQGDVAEVSEHGQAIPPGSQGFIGITIIQITDLEPPYGKCREDLKLQHYSRYTQGACYSVCIQDRVEEHCHCSYNYDNPFIHHDHVDAFPSCTLGQYLDCVVPTINTLHDLHKICDCPHSCHRTHFETSITYGATSNFDMAEIVHNVNETQLSRKYHKAKEKRQLVDPYLRANDANLAQKLQQYINALDFALTEIPKKIDTMTKTFLNTAAILDQRIKFHYVKGLFNVKYVIEHDFVRGWDILEERTFNHVATGFWEILASFDHVLLMLSTDWRFKSLDYREVAWYYVDDQLLTRHRRADRARVNLTEVDVAYRTGKTLLNFYTTIDRRYDLLYVPLHLLNNEQDSQEKYYTTANDSLTKYMLTIDKMREFGALEASNNRQGNESISEARNDFIAAAKQINYRLFQFKSVVLMKPVELIDEIISNFLAKNTSFWWEYDYLQTVITGLRSDIEKLKIGSWDKVKELGESYYTYSHQYTGGNMTKMNLASKFNSKKMKSQLLEMDHLFTSARARARDMQDTSSRLLKLYKDIFRAMVNEESTKRFYKKINEDYNDFIGNDTTDFIRIFASMLREKRSTVRNMSLIELKMRLNADFVELDLETELSKIQTFFDNNINIESDILGLINNNDEEILDHIQSIQTLMGKYIEESEISFKFFRENYLDVDVYMRDLSYENIHHQKAYDLVNLWSDIGGSVGLFVGASALSLFEIIDVFIHTGLKIGLEKEKRKKGQQSSEDNKKYQESGLMS